MGVIKRHPILFFGLTLSFLILIFGFTRIGFLEVLDLKVYDLMMGMREDPESKSDVALIKISE